MSESIRNYTQMVFKENVYENSFHLHLKMIILIHNICYSEPIIHELSKMEIGDSEDTVNGPWAYYILQICTHLLCCHPGLWKCMAVSALGRPDGTQVFTLTI